MLIGLWLSTSELAARAEQSRASLADKAEETYDAVEKEPTLAWSASVPPPPPAVETTPLPKQRKLPRWARPPQLPRRPSHRR